MSTLMSTLPSLALLAVRAALIFAVALVVVRLLARAPAAARRSVLAAAFAIVLALPIATAVLPAWQLRSPDVVEVAPAAMPAIPEPIDELGERTTPSTAIAGPVIAHAVAARVAPPSRSPLGIALAIWALGAAAVLARLGVGILRARRLVRAAKFLETLDVGGRPVEVRLSSEIETPAVTGLVSPVVLLPRDATGWTTERRDVVLAHELAHVASRDCLANLVAQLAVAVHWFDPLAWLAARRLRVERELAADERVVAGGVLPSRYAEHLLALATGAEHAMPDGLVAMAEPSEVALRIRALLAARERARLGRLRHGALIGAGLAIATLVACATPEREEAVVVATPPAAPAPAPAPAPAFSPMSASTIDPQIQAIAAEELASMAETWAPCAAIVVVLDPATGHVLAAAHHGGTETTGQLAAVRALVAGSTVKPFVVAAALEEGAIAATDRFDATPPPNATLRDAEPHGVLDVREILAVSSNRGLAKIAERIGTTQVAAYAKRFHLAAAPATIADASKLTDLAVRGRVASTPLEIAAAFATLANAGVYHAPTFVPRATDPGERVVRAETARTTLALLEGVIGDGGTGTAARVAGVRVAGKTGTAQLGSANDTYASFVGAAPVEQPRYVIFVGAETPRDGGTGGKVAAPVFGRVMARLLARSAP